MKKKRRVIFRIFPFNILSFPVLLNVWKQHEIDLHFEVVVSKNKITPKPGDVFIFSFMTVHTPIIYEEISDINNKNILLVGGGPHINGEQELAFLMGFDILLVGWGEKNFLAFGLDLINNNLPKQRKMYHHKNEIHHFENYFPISQYQKTLPPLELMRGCTCKCKYCQTGNYEPVFRSIDSINLYFELLKKRGKKRVNFICSSSIKFKNISLILNQAKNYGFDHIEYGIFPSELDPHTITPHLLELLKKTVSNKSLTIGVQSGDNTRLSELKRNYTTDNILAVVALINRYNFKANLDFIIGYPRETKAERELTLNFIEYLKNSYNVFIQLHYFFPLSGCDYAFCFPSFLSDIERSKLLDMTNCKVVNNGWIQNEISIKRYFNWLKYSFPDYYSYYS